MQRRAFLASLLASAAPLILPETRRVYSFMPGLWMPDPVVGVGFIGQIPLRALRVGVGEYRVTFPPGPSIGMMESGYGHPPMNAVVMPSDPRDHRTHVITRIARADRPCSNIAAPDFRHVLVSVESLS